MSTRTFNKAEILGNVGEEPRLTETQGGTAVCTFRIATNRTWSPSDSDEVYEETEWHNIVAFGKLADICKQVLQRGTKVFVSGHLQTREFYGDEENFDRVEIVAEDMIALDKRKQEY